MQYESNLFEDLVNASLDSMQVLQAVRNGGDEIIDFKYLLNNKAAIDIYGNLTGKKLSDLYPGLIDIYKQVAVTGIPDQRDSHDISGWYQASIVRLYDGVAVTIRNITGQKKAELEVIHLKDSITEQVEHKYLTLFNNMVQGFCIIEVLFDESGKAIDYIFLEANPVFEEQTGLQDAVGKSMRELQPAHDDHWFRIYGDVVKKQEAIHFENEASALKGGIWYDVFAFPYGHRSANQVALLFNDITDRKRQQRRQDFLLALSDRLRSLTDPVLLQTTACELLKDFLGAASVYFTDTIIAVPQDKGAWSNLESDLIRDTGERLHLAVERAVVQEALAQKEALLNSVFMVSPIGLAYLNMDGQILIMNDEMRRFLPRNIIPSKDSKLQWQAWHQDGSIVQREDFPGIRALQGNPVQPFLEMLYTNDVGGEVWARVAATPVRDEKGNVTGAVTVITDINTLKTTTQQLEELLRQKDVFIGMASHELKTPVTTMKVYAEIVQERLETMGDKEDSELLDRLNKQIDRLIALINSLLDTTSLAEGRLILNIDRFDISALLEERVAEIQLKSTHPIKLETAPLPLLTADKERITQVITNLISNAIKYSPEGAEITVSSREVNGHIEVCVKDKGLGIEAENLLKVFGRFFRVTTNQSNTYPGMGLGLYISAQIIERHKGKIWVESELGRGSAFYFSLPYTTLLLP